MTDEAREKAALRSCLLNRRRAFGRNARYDARIARAVAETPQWDAARCVLAYLPLSWEIGTRDLIGLALSQGKRLCLPVCRENGEMDAVAADENTVYRTGGLGIREPSGGERLPPEQVDLILVPALAFGREGSRLGRGGGYYDRWLADSDAFSIGLCYTQFLFDALPKQPHDIPVRAICTQEGMMWIER